MLSVEDLGQREVVAGLGLRAGSHRDAEAGPAGLEAVDGDDEGAVAAGGVVAVDEAAAEEHPVLDLDRVQLARAHAQERERGPLERLLLDLGCTVSVSVRLPEPDVGRKEELLPRVRTDGVSEPRVVLPPLEAVRPAVLAIRPTGWQLGGRFELGVDDCAVSNRRSEDEEAASLQDVNECVEPFRAQHCSFDVLHATSLR